jgi:hypothetical protein
MGIEQEAEIRFRSGTTQTVTGEASPPVQENAKTWPHRAPSGRCGEDIMPRRAPFVDGQDSKWRNLPG